MFQHDGEAGLAGGASVGATRKFVYCAPGGKSGYSDPLQAEEYLMKNLCWYELPYTGFMEFSEGDAEKVRERLHARLITDPSVSIEERLALRLDHSHDTAALHHRRGSIPCDYGDRH